MVREGGEEPGEEAYDSLETDPLLFRGVQDGAGGVQDGAGGEMVREGGEVLVKKLMTLLKLTLYCSGGVQDGAGGEMVREVGKEPGEEAYVFLETDPLMLRGSSRQSRRRNGARRR